MKRKKFYEKNKSKLIVRKRFKKVEKKKIDERRMKSPK